MKARKAGQPRPPMSSSTRAGPPLVLDLGPAVAYVIRRAARHIEGLPDGGALAVDVGPRRVTVERRPDGWTVDGQDLASVAAVLAELQAAAAAWLTDRAAA